MYTEALLEYVTVRFDWTGFFACLLVKKSIYSNKYNRKQLKSFSEQKRQHNSLPTHLLTFIYQASLICISITFNTLLYNFSIKEYLVVFVFYAGVFYECILSVMISNLQCLVFYFPYSASNFS